MLEKRVFHASSNETPSMAVSKKIYEVGAHFVSNTRPGHWERGSETTVSPRSVMASKASWCMEATRASGEERCAGV